MGRIRVLPVYPKFPLSFWSFRYALEVIGIEADEPPLGLLTAAAMFPEDRFEMMPVADMNVGPLRNEDIRRADVVMASAMQVQKKPLEEVVDQVHKQGKKVIVGGPYPTSYPEEVAGDHVIMWEAEMTIGPFIKDYLAGKAGRIYDRVDENALLTPGGKPVLSQTPIPRWDLVDLKKYNTIPVQYSRGCPFGCKFCDIIHLFGREPRTKGVEQMLREFDAIYDRGWRGPVFPVDDNFIGNKKNVRMLLPALKRWQEERRFPFSLFTEASLDLGSVQNKDILEGMVAAGFTDVFGGIESVDPDVLRGMKKQQNAEDMDGKIRRIQKAGLEVMGGFVIGSDGEKPEVFDRLFEFIQRTGIVIPMPGLLTAAKHTPLYKELEEAGRLRGESSGNNTHQLGFNFKTELDENLLIDGYVGLLEKLFESKNYYERCRTLQKRRGKYRRAGRVDGSGIRTCGKTLYENIFRKPDIEFIKYALETAITRTRDFPEAIAQAVKLRHFKTVTRATSQVYDYREVVESIYNRFQKKVGKLRRKFEGDAQEQWRHLQITGRKMMDKAQAKYLRLHEDFRENAEEMFENLRGRIEGYLENYRLEMEIAEG